MRCFTRISIEKFMIVTEHVKNYNNKLCGDIGDITFVNMFAPFKSQMNLNLLVHTVVEAYSNIGNFRKSSVNLQIFLKNVGTLA